jgi:hypothetical protein
MCGLGVVGTSHISIHAVSSLEGIPAIGGLEGPPRGKYKGACCVVHAEVAFGEPAMHVGLAKVVLAKRGAEWEVDILSMSLLPAAAEESWPRLHGVEGVHVALREAMRGFHRHEALGVAPVPSMEITHGRMTVSEENQMRWRLEAAWEHPRLEGHTALVECCVWHQDDRWFAIVEAQGPSRHPGVDREGREAFAKQLAETPENVRAIQSALQVFHGMPMGLGGSIAVQRAWGLSVLLGREAPQDTEADKVEWAQFQCEIAWKRESGMSDARLSMHRTNAQQWIACVLEVPVNLPCPSA